MRSRITVLLSLVLALLFSLPVSAEELSANAMITPHTVLVGENSVDQANSLYPLLLYKDITYFPLTWNYGVCLGYGVEFDATEGLYITSAPGTMILVQDLIAEDGQPNDLLSEVVISFPSFPVFIQGVQQESDTEWPCLLFRDITYMPLTWDNAVSLGINYNFDNDEQVLSFSASQPAEVEDTTSDEPTTRPEPIKSTTVESLLPNGHKITLAEAMKIQSFNKDTSNEISFGAFAIEAPFVINAMGDKIEGLIKADANLELGKVYAEVTVSPETLAALGAEEDFTSVQFALIANPENTNEFHIYGKFGAESWEYIPLPLTIPNMEMFAELSKLQENDEEAIEKFATMLEDMGMSVLADLIRNPEDSEALMSIYSALDYEESTKNGIEVFSIGFNGTMDDLFAVLGIDLASFYSNVSDPYAILEDPFFADLTEEEIAEFKAIIDEQNATQMDAMHNISLAFVVDFSMETGVPLNYTYQVIMNPDEYTLVNMLMNMTFTYDSEEDTMPTKVSFNMIVEEPSIDEVEVSFEIDFIDSFIDWEDLEAVLAEVAIEEDPWIDE